MIFSAIETELLRNALASVVDETYAALMKSAYSTNIKERKDHSTAIFDAQGRIVAQGESLPLHLGSMLGLVEVVLARYGVHRLEPGDMFLSNDPFVGKGSHLPDVALVAPVFDDGELVMFVSNIAHHADIGGMAPGSMAGGMTEVYQEGLRIPPIKLVSGGTLDEDLMELILLNVRVPTERRGDFAAQIATNQLGVRRCQELLGRWSKSRLSEGMRSILEASARRMRQGIAELPDGEYRASDVVDDDGLGTVNIPICVRIVIEGDHIRFDFEGSGPQVRGNINVTTAGLQASVLYALKCLIDPATPPNHGMLAPVQISAPEHSIVNASFPAATAGRAQTCQRIIDVIFQALAPAVPERAIASSNGSNTSVVFSGAGPEGRYYLYMETIGGGAGARSYKDGTDGVQVHVTNTSNLPVEAMEQEYPLLVERYELVSNSGGVGAWRGGLGLRRSYRAVGHVMSFSAQSERCNSHPPGLFGGGPGANGSLEIIHDDGTRVLLPAKPTTVVVPPTAVLSVTTPGGGGYGPSSNRLPELVRQDAITGKNTRAD